MPLPSEPTYSAPFLRLIDEAPAQFHLGHASALAKLTSEAALVDALHRVRPLLKPAAFSTLLGQQLHRVEHPQLDLEGWFSLMTNASDDDIWDLMTIEEKAVHADLDEELLLFGCGNKAGSLVWWHLTEREALAASPGMLDVVNAVAERRRCVLQFCPEGVRLLPAEMIG
ncbi:hypothetical protein CDL60_14215 [Roseateles noduli]|nr:hypothetical protein CDL60_14215 [Roseateles noduli]